jgi:hypothetical protein
MFKAIANWWKQLGESEEELARLGIYTYTNAYGQPTYIQRETNDRQETHKRSTKKSKRQR